MNKSLKVPFAIIFIILIISSGIYAVFFHIPVTTITYTQSEEVLINPSRGFYVQVDTGHLSELSSLRNEGVSLVLLAFDIAEFVDTDISKAKLEELDLALEIVRANGLKAILRTAYGFYDAQAYQDPHSLEIIKAHIQQLSPLFHEHQDVLLTVQAGFLGPWGEWHHSNLDNLEGDLEASVVNEMIKALCDAIPAPISIAVRRPSFIRLIDASMIDITRIAFHNDALLSGDSDMNTYDLTQTTRQSELDFINERGYPVANGGEMPSLSAYTQADQALEEFTKLNLTYLNREYNRAVLDEWQHTRYQDQDFLDLINMRLGYRWWLSSAKVPKQLNRGQNLSLHLTLFNSGFSAVSVPYAIELVVYENSTILQTLPFDKVNLQDLKPQASLKINIKINTSKLPDQFKLGLRIKENHQSLQEDTRYMVELANTELKYTNGINTLVTYQWDGKSKYTLVNE